MKIREDFITNSSSSSYIICFARIADKEKAEAVIKKHDLDVFDRQGVIGEKSWGGVLGAGWCGATIWNVDNILAENPDDKYIIIEDSNEGVENEWGEATYDYDYSMDDAIAEITKENGFADIEIAEGEGRDG